MGLVVDSENYFEIAEALHCWLSLNHAGQWSDTYAMLCRSKFKPGPLWSESECEARNEFVSQINESNVRETFENLTAYMENCRE